MNTPSSSLAPRSPAVARTRAAPAWAVGLLAMVSLVSVASARPKPPRDGFPPLPHLIERLALTPDQITAERKRHDASREAAKPIEQTIRATHDQIRLLWAAEKPSREAILAKMAELDALRGKVAALRVDAHLAFIASLTDAQRAELRKMLAEPPPPPGEKRPGKRHDR